MADLSEARTTGNNSYTTMQGDCDWLRARLNANDIITATQWNTLINIWNAFNDHVHSVSDLYGIQSYGDGIGNANAYSTTGSYEYENTSAPVFPLNVGTDVAGVSGPDSEEISVARHNDLVYRMMNGLYHRHTWDDRAA